MEENANVDIIEHRIRTKLSNDLPLCKQLSRSKLENKLSYRCYRCFCHVLYSCRAISDTNWCFNSKYCVLRITPWHIYDLYCTLQQALTFHNTLFKLLELPGLLSKNFTIRIVFVSLLLEVRGCRYTK